MAFGAARFQMLLEVQPGLLSQPQDLEAGVGVAKMERSGDSLKAPRSSHHCPLSILSPLSSPLVAITTFMQAQLCVIHR